MYIKHKAAVKIVFISEIYDEIYPVWSYEGDDAPAKFQQFKAENSVEPFTESGFFAVDLLNEEGDREKCFIANPSLVESITGEAVKTEDEYQQIEQQRRRKIFHESC